VLIDDLSALATGRSYELFTDDLQSRRMEIEERTAGRRILVIGGAGSVGSATVRALLTFNPEALHVIDQSENNLAEMTRDLRSSSSELDNIDFRTLPVDYGSSVMHRFILEQRPYDYVLNFAALKHVRSEKDTYSLLQMLDTNLIKLARLLCWLQEKGGTASFFSVSTDKAANPVNLMGASKRIMEHMIFSGEIAPDLKVKMTSARFANVAFSDGSLLQSFLKRLEKHQPLASPTGTRRFFISLREAGQLCLLAAICAPENHLLIPRLDPDSDLFELKTIATAVLEYYGFEPRFYDNEEEAKAGVESDVESGHYPLLLTPLDTSGEKSYEEFVSDGEECVEVGMSKLLGVPYRPGHEGSLLNLLTVIEEFLSHPKRNIKKERIISEISTVVPELSHIESGRSLDERM